MAKSLLLVSLLSLACSAAGERQPVADPDRTSDPVVAPEPVAHVHSAPELPPVGPELLPVERERALYVSPSPELFNDVWVAALDYWDTFGVRVNLLPSGDPRGISITSQDEVRFFDGTSEEGQLVDGLAHFDRFCTGYDCSPEYGVTILVASALLDEKAWAMRQTLRHELGHVLSGWGQPSGLGMHLPEMAGVMSPGCRNHVCAPWTEADAEMICAGVQCQYARDLE